MITRRALMAGAGLASLAGGFAEAAAPLAASTRPPRGGFGLVQNGRPASVFVDPNADPALRHAATRFVADLGLLSGAATALLSTLEGAQGPVVIAGIVGQCPVLSQLVAQGKLDVSAISGKWEGYVQAVVANPTPGIAQALIIAGADRRGAVYGIYDIAERMGVSPWYWFADVPVARQRNFYLAPGSVADWPRVRYRGIFINDEDPCFSGWAQKRFGGVNAELYERVFELILRLKGNYLWPAMWAPKSFHLDDPRSSVLADEMGVVMGTSHHEPLTRAQAEWHRLEEPWTGGAWDYATNGDNLRRFWRGGIERMMSKGDGRGYENLITVGMRGDGDAPMSEGTAIELLQGVVRDQRQIISDVTGRPASETPQMWALYKEVQDYYDHGMRAPDDVTLLFADDNWGQIRRLPTGDLDRAGGHGVYYHFDYVGAPRNYKWLNTNQIGKVWQQMDLAYKRGARSIWVVNVGDIKPMEHPLDFFMKMAWNPERMTPAALADFPRNWAERLFGADLAPRIGRQVALYSQYAARRKPELIDENTWPIGDAQATTLTRGEFDCLVELWRALVADVEATKPRLRPEQRDAYFQLIEFPVLALANLYEMYLATAWNRRLSSRHDPRANWFLAEVERTFARDAELTRAYHSIAGGKWDGMMSQVHMNYKIWNDPTQQTMPSVARVAGDVPARMRDAAAIFVDPPGEGAPIVVSAADYTRSISRSAARWTPIAHLGQSEAAIVALPQGAAASELSDEVRAEYSVNLPRDGEWRVALHLLPTLNTDGGEGIRVGVSIDDGPTQILTSHLEPTPGAASSSAQRNWYEAVTNNRVVVSGPLGSVTGGRHVLKVWRLDDNAILERLTLTPV